MKHLSTLSLAMALVLFVACRPTAAPEAETAGQDNVYQFSVAAPGGEQVPLDSFSHKVLLIVNTATQCGFTPQYEELQALYNRFGSRGFEVLDFPCNQFGAQAPGTYDDIHGFCTGTYGITFPQFEKVDVNGDSAAALFVWLKAQAPFGGFDTTDPRGAYLDAAFRAQDSLYDSNPDIKWNFTKFLIDRQGNVAGRFEPTASMEEVAKAIEALL